MNREPRRTLALASLGVAALLLATSAVLAQMAPPDAGVRRVSPPAIEASLDASVRQQLERGAELYAFHCTTCHGASGAGFEEARSAFPTDHQSCSRCHMPLNPPVMTPQQIESSQSVFSLGVAPPLNDAAALGRFGTAAALHGYIRATMPRWAPGYVGDEAKYVDILAYVLHLAGRTPERPLSADELGALTLP